MMRLHHLLRAAPRRNSNSPLPEASRKHNNLQSHNHWDRHNSREQSPNKPHRLSQSARNNNFRTQVVARQQPKHLSMQVEHWHCSPSKGDTLGRLHSSQEMLNRAEAGV